MASAFTGYAAIKAVRGVQVASTAVRSQRIILAFDALATTLSIGEMVRGIAADGRLSFWEGLENFLRVAGLGLNLSSLRSLTKESEALAEAAADIQRGVGRQVDELDDALELGAEAVEEAVDTANGLADTAANLGRRIDDSVSTAARLENGHTLRVIVSKLGVVIGYCTDCITRLTSRVSDLLGNSRFLTEAPDDLVRRLKSLHQRMEDLDQIPKKGEFFSEDMVESLTKELKDELDDLFLRYDPEDLLLHASPGTFRLGRHGDFPSPRPTGTQSHHGVMSAWMKKHFLGYDPDKAPAILMPTANHEKTFGTYNTWRAAARQRMGGKFDWGKVFPSVQIRSAHPDRSASYSSPKLTHPSVSTHSPTSSNSE